MACGLVRNVANDTCVPRGKNETPPSPVGPSAANLGHFLDKIRGLVQGLAVYQLFHLSLLDSLENPQLLTNIDVKSVRTETPSEILNT